MELEEIAEGRLDDAACPEPEDLRDPEPAWVDAYEW